MINVFIRNSVSLYIFFSLRFATDHLAKSLNESMKLRNGDPDGNFSHLTDCAVKSMTNGRPSPQQIGTNGGYGINYNPHYGSNGGVSRSTAEYRPPPYQSQSSPDSLTVLSKRHSPPQQPQQQPQPQQVVARLISKIFFWEKLNITDRNLNVNC